MYQIKEFIGSYYMNINNDFVIDHRELIISILCYVRSSHIITKRFFLHHMFLVSYCLRYYLRYWLSFQI